MSHSYLDYTRTLRGSNAGNASGPARKGSRTMRSLDESNAMTMQAYRYILISRNKD